ncbi:sugar nucleotide-binding protein [Paenibacillus rhizoplanae]
MKIRRRVRSDEKKTDKFFIIRTSWAYGVSGKNFVSTMLRIGKKQESVDVVSDQVGSPTYTADLSKLIVSMIKTEKNMEFIMLRMKVFL